MRGLFRRRNPFASFSGATKREQYLERYVLREHKRGRAFAEILDDAYIRNRSTPAERARLLERLDVVAAIGEHSLRELRSVDAAGVSSKSAGQAAVE
jgi:hypothetical protein